MISAVISLHVIVLLTKYNDLVELLWSMLCPLWMKLVFGHMPFTEKMGLGPSSEAFESCLSVRIINPNKWGMGPKAALLGTLRPVPLDFVVCCRVVLGTTHCTTVLFDTDSLYPRRSCCLCDNIGGSRWGFGGWGWCNIDMIWQGGWSLGGAGHVGRKPCACIPADIAVLPCGVDNCLDMSSSQNMELLCFSD